VALLYFIILTLFDENFYMKLDFSNKNQMQYFHSKVKIILVWTNLSLDDGSCGVFDCFDPYIVLNHVSGAIQAFYRFLFSTKNYYVFLVCCIIFCQLFDEGGIVYLSLFDLL
jgi:hypothetical protein